MADDDGARRLSPKYNEMAKDDPDAVLRRRAEALGKPGLEAHQNITEQRDRTYDVRYKREIEQTKDQRYSNWVNRRFDDLTSPAPNKNPMEPTPELYKKVQEQGTVWLTSDTEQRTKHLREEVDQQRRKVLERTFDRMEAANAVNRSQDRSQDMGRGRSSE